MLTGIAFTVWASLEASYPGRWIRTTGDVLDADNRLASVARKWASAAARFEASDIEQAVDWLATDRQGAEWLPSIGQFVSAARSFRDKRLSREQLALPERTAEPVVTPEGQAAARQAIAQAWVSLGQRKKAVEMLDKYGEVLDD